MRNKLIVLFLFLLLMGCSEDDPRRIGNRSTKVFHTTSCYYVSQIIDKVSFNSRDEAITNGYRPDESNKCDP